MSGAIVNNFSKNCCDLSNFFKKREDTAAKYKQSILSGWSFKLISSNFKASLKRLSLTAKVASFKSTDNAVSLLSKVSFVIFY